MVKKRNPAFEMFPPTVDLRVWVFGASLGSFPAMHWRAFLFLYVSAMLSKLIMTGIGNG